MFLLDITNSLTIPALLKTIAFQVGLLGSGTIIIFLKVVPYLNDKSGIHQINANERAVIYDNPVLRKWFAKANKWFDHPFYFLTSYLLKGTTFIVLLGTLGILLTDVGWIPAFAKYTFPSSLLFARASGAPNGAHLLSYIPLPFLGLYVAYKFRKDILLDCYQGILIIAFGVAAHEGIWIVAYYIHYSVYLNLGLWPNITEDIFFTIMCVMFIFAFWKYPFRTIPLRIFKWPIVIYSGFIGWWLSIGMPVSTLNNYQIGKGIFMVTQYWADPFVNAIEILSWILITFLFFVEIYYHENQNIRA